MTDPHDMIYEIRPSEPRRIFGCIVQGLLGLIVIYVAFAIPPVEVVWRLFLFAIGIVALVAAVQGWRASSGGIVLTQNGLVDHDGTVIAALENIAKVDRALFTFKPAQGFLVRLKEPETRAWRPGMWWRIGRRVGIGGVTSGAQTKIVADTLSMMVADRDKDPDTL